MNVQLPATKPSLTVIDNQVLTNSFEVSNSFGKQHKHVTEKIRSLACSKRFLTANFSAVKYAHKGNSYEAYNMTKNGFMFLVMGFTGKKAAAFKEAYILAFDEMELRLQKRAGGLSECEKYKMLNATIKQLDMKDTAVVVPYTDIAQLIGFCRSGQEAANRLEQCSTNVELTINRMKNVTSYHLADQ